MKIYQATVLLFVIIISSQGCIKTLTIDELCNETHEDLMMTVSEWHYCGSKEGYHYFYNYETGFDSGTYRVKENELKLIKTIPFTKNRNEWLLLSWGSPFPENIGKSQALVDGEQNCFSLWNIDLNNMDYIIDTENNILHLIDNKANAADAKSRAAD